MIIISIISTPHGVKHVLAFVLDKLRTRSMQKLRHPAFVAQLQHETFPSPIPPTPPLTHTHTVGVRDLYHNTLPSLHCLTVKSAPPISIILGGPENFGEFA
jgi:hypothetical protein